MKWHIYFTEQLYGNGWGPLFRYEMASGTRAEALEKLKKHRQRAPGVKFRIVKFVRVPTGKSEN